MGIERRLAAALGLAVLCAGKALAQSTVVLPTIDVTYSRWGGFVAGASSSVITAEDIARMPSQNLPDILS